MMDWKSTGHVCTLSFALFVFGTTFSGCSSEGASSEALPHEIDSGATQEARLQLAQNVALVTDGALIQPTPPSTGKNVLPLLLSAAEAVNRGQYQFPNAWPPDGAPGDYFETLRDTFDQPGHQKALSYLVQIESGDYLWFDRDYANQSIYGFDRRHYTSISGAVDALGAAGLLAAKDGNHELATDYLVKSRRWANALASDHFTYATISRLSAENVTLRNLTKFWEICGLTSECLARVETIFNEPVEHHFARDHRGEFLARWQRWHQVQERRTASVPDGAGLTHTPEAEEFMDDMQAWHKQMLALFDRLDRQILPSSEEELRLIARGDEANYTLTEELSTVSMVVTFPVASVFHMAESLWVNQCMITSAMQLVENALGEPSSFRTPDEVLATCPNMMSITDDRISFSDSSVHFVGDSRYVLGQRVADRLNQKLRVTLPLGESSDPRFQAYWAWLQAQN